MVSNAFRNYFQLFSSFTFSLIVKKYDFLGKEGGTCPVVCEILNYKYRHRDIMLLLGIESLCISYYKNSILRAKVIERLIHGGVKVRGVL